MSADRELFTITPSERERFVAAMKQTHRSPLADVNKGARLTVNVDGLPELSLVVDCLRVTGPNSFVLDAHGPVVPEQRSPHVGGR